MSKPLLIKASSSSVAYTFPMRLNHSSKCLNTYIVHLCICIHVLTEQTPMFLSIFTCFPFYLQAELQQRRSSTSFVNIDKSSFANFQCNLYMNAFTLHMMSLENDLFLLKVLETLFFTLHNLTNDTLTQCNSLRNSLSIAFSNFILGNKFSSVEISYKLK